LSLINEVEEMKKEEIKIKPIKIFSLIME
jgi:hypothetical protein